MAQRKSSGQQRSPGRRTVRDRRIVVGGFDSLGSDLVDRGRGVFLLAERGEVAVAEIIRQDQNHIRRARLRRCIGPRRAMIHQPGEDRARQIGEEESHGATCSGVRERIQR